MSESEFWSHLEYRVCHEFSGMLEAHFRSRWCDGIIPTDYQLHLPYPRITGRAWICEGRGQENWEFTLLLDNAVASPSDINWESLLPPNNTTRWMALDLARKHIEFEPAAAVSDLDPQTRK